MANACDALALPFFLVDAFARDLLLKMRHGFKVQWATLGSKLLIPFPG